MGDVESVLIVREIRARSQVRRLPKDFLTLEQNKKISSNLLAQEKEFLFSRSVLLVEGSTEYGAMPILAKRMAKSFDENGVTLVSVEGNYFGLMLKLLDGFGFSWYALCDKDALLNISGKGHRIRHGHQNQSSLQFSLQRQSTIKIRNSLSSKCPEPHQNSERGWENQRNICGLAIC